MLITFAKNTTILMLVVFVVGCTTVWEGSGANDGQTQMDVAEPPVNSYYLFSQAHIKTLYRDFEGAIADLHDALSLDPESLYLKKELATLLVMNKEEAKALDILEDVLTDHPDDVEALILSGRIHQGMKQIEPAMANYEKALLLDPSNENLYLQLGRMHIEQQQWDKAQNVYEKLIDHFPGSYAGYFFLGRISMVNGNHQTAKSYFEKTLVLEPDLVESRFELGLLYEAEGNYKKAATAYKEILKRNPSNVQARMALGLNYYSQGKTKTSNQVFQELGRMSVSDTMIVRTLVKEYIDVRNFEDADIIVTGMLAGAPDSSDLLYISGITSDGLGKKSDAIMRLKMVQPQSRFFENATIHTALLYQEMERRREAVDFLLTAIEKAPENAEFRYYLGSLYEQMKEYENAEKELKTGIRLDPDHSRLHFRLGVLYDKQGNKEESIAEMKTVLELDPENANALNYLGYTYADMGVHLDEAEQLIRKAMILRPDDGYITDSLAWVYYKREQYEKALPLLELAVSLEPDDPVIEEHLGDVYRKLGMKKRAIQSYRKAIEKGHEDKASLLFKIQSLSQ